MCVYKGRTIGECYFHILNLKAKNEKKTPQNQKQPPSKKQPGKHRNHYWIVPLVCILIKILHTIPKKMLLLKSSAI